MEINLSKNGELKLKNVSEFKDIPGFPLWCVELLAGLPVRKMYLRDLIIPDHGFSPFLTTL